VPQSGAWSGPQSSPQLLPQRGSGRRCTTQEDHQNGAEVNEGHLGTLPDNGRGLPCTAYRPASMHRAISRQAAENREGYQEGWDRTEWEECDWDGIRTDLLASSAAVRRRRRSRARSSAPNTASWCAVNADASIASTADCSMCSSPHTASVPACECGQQATCDRHAGNTLH